jgi:hypothetical protein
LYQETGYQFFGAVRFVELSFDCCCVQWSDVEIDDVMGVLLLRIAAKTSESNTHHVTGDNNVSSSVATTLILSSSPQDQQQQNGTL